VDQRGIDVVVTLLGPRGEHLVRVDSPNGARGPEPVVVVAPATGRYRLEVRSPDPRAAAAEQLFSQGEELRQRDDAASLCAAIDRERRALALVDVLGERGRRADVLYFLGSAQLSLADLPGALGSYQQALAAFREAGREREAAGTANQLGQVLRLLGEPARALARYQEALAAARRLGEPWTEAAVALLGQALAIYGAEGRRRNMARALTSLGDAHARAGRSRQAMAALLRSLEDRRGEGVTLAASPGSATWRPRPSPCSASPAPAGTWASSTWRASPRRRRSPGSRRCAAGRRAPGCAPASWRSTTSTTTSTSAC